MMGFSSTGVYTPAAGALTAAPGGIIKSSVWNAIFTDMTAAFTSVAQTRFLLNTLTAATSATLGDTTSLTTTFRDYEIVFDNIIAATNAVSLEFQFHSGGSFQATTYINNSIGSNGSATLLSSVASTTFIPLTVTTIANAGVTSGSIKFYGPVTAGTTGKLVTGQMVSQNGAIMVNTMVCGYWNNTAAVDGFQILFSSGNITSGTVKIYGLT